MHRSRRTLNLPSQHFSKNSLSAHKMTLWTLNCLSLQMMVKSEYLPLLNISTALEEDTPAIAQHAARRELDSGEYDWEVFAADMET